MRSAAWGSTAVLGCLLLTGCPERGEPRSIETSVSTSAVTAPATSGARSTTTAPKPARVELLALTLTSGVREKDPVDELKSVAPGERVYAHLRIRNRTGKTHVLTLDFSVNGEQRTTLTLDVEPSWSWRTWGYNTVLPSDRPGLLDVTVTDEGAELAAAKLPILAKKR